MARMNSQEDVVPSYFTPNTNSYYGNMNIIAQVQNEKGEVLNNCELATFVAGECRGAGTPMGDEGFVFLTVAGEDGQSDSVGFEVFVPSLNRVVKAETPKLKYVNDALVGSLSNPYIVKISSIFSGFGNSLADKIQIYPTITRDEVFVNTDTKSLKQITVTDISGRVMIQNTALTTHNVLHLDGYAPGVYLISVMTSDGEYFVKHVIKK
jgi:hypothetical protein